jgi:transcriptional regulator with XRE-family HTH domain
MSTKISEVFTGRLKAAREMRKLSQGELASRAGLQPSAVSHFETGARKPSFDNLRRLGDALEVNIDYLLGRVDKPTGVGPATDRLHRHLDRLSESDRQFAENLLEQLAGRGRKEN